MVINTISIFLAVLAVLYTGVGIGFLATGLAAYKSNKLLADLEPGMINTITRAISLSFIFVSSALWPATVVIVILTRDKER